MICGVLASWMVTIVPNRRGPISDRCRKRFTNADGCLTCDGDRNAALMRCRLHSAAMTALQGAFGAFQVSAAYELAAFMESITDETSASD
jgi:hypothetical protein